MTTGRRFTRRSLWAAAVVMAGSFTACSSNAPQDALKPAGPDSHKLDTLFKPVFWIAVAVFVLVEGLIVYCVIRFRARSDDDAPVQVHGNFKAELGWTIAPAVLLLVIGVFTIKTIFDINRVPKGTNVVQVDVTGHRWWWEYQYPGMGITTANELHIPVGRPVAITLTSGDVIHNFWPPRLAGKVYAIPGRHNHMALEADKPGVYYGQCAEYCGTSHANMRLRVIAMSASDWDAWVSNQKAGPAFTPTTTTSTDPATQGAALFLSKGCAGCHTVNGFSAGTVGPNLTHLQSRDCFAGCILDMNDQDLRRWLRNPPGEKPGSVMPNLNLSETEITQLIAYLDTLK